MVDLDLLRQGQTSEMLVSILLCDIKMQSTLTRLHCNGFEFKRSRSLSDLVQRLLSLNILKSETYRLVVYSNMLINQDRHTLSDEFVIWLYCTFCLRVTCPVVLKKIIFDIIHHIATLIFTSSSSNLLITSKIITPQMHSKLYNLLWSPLFFSIDVGRFIILGGPRLRIFLGGHGG